MGTAFLNPRDGVVGKRRSMREAERVAVKFM